MRPLPCPFHLFSLFFLVQSWGRRIPRTGGWAFTTSSVDVSTNAAVRSAVADASEAAKAALAAKAARPPWAKAPLASSQWQALAAAAEETGQSGRRRAMATEEGRRLPLHPGLRLSLQRFC